MIPETYVRDLGVRLGLYKRIGEITDKNGEIKAADARLILRASVGLEKLSEKDFSLSDTDGDRKITASDARKILRRAAKLE